MSGGWIFIVWMVGLAGAAVVNVVVRSESQRVLRIGRVAFALLLGLDLLFAALIFAVTGASSSRSLWWVIAVFGGWPIAVATGIAVWRGFAGHRFTLAAALVAAAALYLAFPLGFVPAGDKLTGLGRFEHGHHGLDVLLLLTPTLMVIASELLRGRVAEEDDPSMLTRLRNAPRRVVVGSAAAVLAYVWLLGASGPAVLIVALVAVAGLLLFGWWQTRTVAKAMRRDLDL